ncbi:anthranilate phosphoribosyltransferase [Thermosporothrix hazakensis]|jgi:anthranilate phosphoribosyltransferase|uniref:Anthranilate phosphoribosyltransferase n=2 Tax=Thermosporothrix TaxID=768650 RepID=A0A326UCA6_THEHA|nr:anthranilate phosphoribosyltransferase [Thermosporothrix hazakensis]PZW36048.1 anthranilate phosphoribosyltransferase [Thermosporothrix hazakensis]BBH88516.1 anthranilate phosphoribosyltransferase [Thermosporothrix sp. COM3]GCE46701.1 anthranilate phosphoribosyltransferase [Thermosporothrix hazakensis]
MTIREAIVQVSAGATLNESEAAAVMEEIMTGMATPSQMGAFLTALRLRPGGETTEEITGLARVMREKALRVHLDEAFATRAMDTCGTGGDRAGTFNVSTAAGILAAAAGATIAKHGNRSATSHCGSADVLEALGATIELTPEQVAYCIQETGFGFMYAPAFHPSMRHVGPTRREIGIRTVFNILGPLTNPAYTPYQVLGVPEASLMRKMGEVLLRLGCKHALIVHGEDGLDECSLSAPTRICEVRAGEELREYTITPEELGLPRVADRDAVRGGSVEENAAIFRMVLSEYTDSPKTHMLCLNAGAALLANDLVPSLQEGVKLAQATLKAGKARQKLAEVIESTQVASGSQVRYVS